MTNTWSSLKAALSRVSKRYNSLQSRLRQATVQKIFLIAGLLLSGGCHAQSCLPEAQPPKQKPVIYEVQDHQLWRHETQTGKRALVKEISDVQTVAQSVLNCINPDQRSHEANMVVVSKTDGTVWIRGVIWDYRVHECSVSPECHPKGPRLMLNTKGQWKQITGFKEVLKVAAGETWVVALTRSRQVFTWGTNKGSEFSLGSLEDEKKRTPLLYQTPQSVFRFPAYRDILAFNDAAYGLLMDGQVTAWADGDSICRIEADRTYDGAKYVCPFVYPQQGNVQRIWQTDGKPEECNAAFVDGQLWQWPCDIRDLNRVLVPRIVPDQIQKSRVPAFGASPPSAPQANTPIFVK